MPLLHHRIIATHSPETSAEILEGLFERRFINWKLIIDDYFDDLAQNNVELPKNASASFKKHITTTTDIGAAEKKSLLRGLATRPATTWDIVFFELERQHPFRANTRDTVKPDIQLPTFRREAFLASLKFFIQYNPKTTEDYAFGQALPSLIYTQFPSSRDLNAEDIRTWVQDTAKTNPLVEAHSENVDSALDRLHYPVEIKNTGSGIYVGTSPLYNPQYFWETLLGLRVIADTPPANTLHIVSLEASMKTEIEHLKPHYAHLSEDDFRDLLQNRLTVPYYWGTQAGTTDRHTHIDIKTESLSRTYDGITDYDISITGHHKASATITHIDCWPDGAIPHERHTEALATTLLTLAKIAQTEQTRLYIHCRAGLGRTGVFRIALEYAMRKVANKPTISPALLLQTYRDTYRYGVQTNIQFGYLDALCQEIASISSPVLDD